VIEGLKGAADLDGNHKVSLAELTAFTQDKVVDFVSHRRGRRQMPTLQGRAGLVTLLDVPRGLSTGIITNSLDMKFTLVKAGEFLMGSPDTDKDALDDEKPQHRVRITRPFYLGVHEVTRAQYKAAMGKDSGMDALTRQKYFRAGQLIGELPVLRIPWLDAVKFCNKLSELEGRKPFYDINGETVRVLDWKASGYRLPTEADWEYACGGDHANLDEHAWFHANSEKFNLAHPVGKKLVNRFGLHDMLGNVWEWCWDAYDKDYYKQSLRDDPMGPDTAGAADRVIRGGSCDTDPRNCRSANRGRGTPVNSYYHVGFRLALLQ